MELLCKVKFSRSVRRGFSKRDVLTLNEKSFRFSEKHVYKKILEMKVFVELRVGVERKIWKVDIIQ